MADGERAEPRDGPCEDHQSKHGTMRTGEEEEGEKGRGEGGEEGHRIAQRTHVTRNRRELVGIAARNKLGDGTQRRRWAWGWVGIERERERENVCGWLWAGQYV